MIVWLSPSLRLGKVLSFNSQFVLAKTFLSKRSFGNYSFFKVSSKWISQVMNLVFGLALWKALVPFRHVLTGSSGFSADAHRHQVSFGLSFKQVGLWFIHPLSSGSSPPLSRLWSRLLLTKHFPFLHCAPNSFSESYDFIHIMIYCWLSALQIPCEESPEIQVSSTSGGSLLMRR